MLELVVTRRASKDLQSLPAGDRVRVERRVEAYVAEPDAPHHDVRPLVGTVALFRLRAGDWRVIFERDLDTMTVLRVHHRREAYR